MDNYKNIIWDWNGTLLNDIDLCISSINRLLEKRKLPLIKKDYYKEIFTFPVIDYYKKIGFDFNKEPFEVPALEFINEYKKNFFSCSLHHGAGEILDYFNKKSKNQYILSAMEQGELEQTVKHFGIEHYFIELIGIRNHYAFSKIEFGKELLKRRNLLVKKTCLIGDSVHDFEVAMELGISCILLSNGHQAKERLLQLNVPVYDRLEDLV